MIRTRVSIVVFLAITAALRADNGGQQTGVMAGDVVSAEGTPLGNAYVVVIGVATGTVHVTSTQADGRFVVTGLPTDDYLVGASKPPYLGAVAGASRPLGPGAAITLAAGQTISTIRISLKLGAVIAGTLVDPGGRPAAHAWIILHQWRTQNGARVLVDVRGSGTDEHGRYRFAGLSPGAYVVSGTSALGPVDSVYALSDTDVDNALHRAAITVPQVAQSARYARVYFPGTLRSADAQSIVLKEGEDRDGADFSLRLASPTTIAGTVITFDGRPLGRTMLRIGDKSAGPGFFPIGLGPDGRFTYSTILPGTYTLIASLAGDNGGLLASAMVDVENVDVTGLQLVLSPPLQFEGHVTFAGGSRAPALAGWRVPILNMTSADVMPMVAPTDASGRFTVTRARPGTYVLGGPLFFGASADSLTWALESVVADGRDITDRPIELSADHLPKDLLVTFSDQWQSLSGTLSAPTGVDPSTYTVLIFPADKTYWMPGSRRIVAVRPSSDGRYTIGGPGPTSLPAGAYLLAVTPDLSDRAQLEPAFLESLAAAAQSQSIAPGAHETHDITVR
jgi:hypothetical protein